MLKVQVISATKLHEAAVEYKERVGRTQAVFVRWNRSLCKKSIRHSRDNIIDNYVIGISALRVSIVLILADHQIASHFCVLDVWPVADQCVSISKQQTEL